MQLSKPHAMPDPAGQKLPGMKDALTARKVATQNAATDDAAGGESAGFDNTLATLMTTLNAEAGRQKIGEKTAETAEPQPAQGQQDDDETAAMAILQSLLAANQHPVKSVALKGNGEKPEHKVATVMLQPQDAATQSAQIQGQTQALGQAETQHAATQPETHGNSVKLVATRPVAATTQQMALIDASQSQPLHADTPSAGSPPEVAAQPAAGAEKNARFSLPDVKLSEEHSRWSEQLHSALGDRLQVQMKDRIQHATIRLDPPNMGKIDISMQLENGRMQVHINASHGDVYRALQQVSHELRQTLVEQNFVQVNVQVSSQHPGQQQDNRQQAFSGQNDAVLASAELAEDENYSSHQDDESVLLTV